MTPRKPLTFEAFQALLAEQLNVEASRVTPEAYFVTDLGADSLRLLQVMLGMEELGIRVPFERLMLIQTVGEAWEAVRGSEFGPR